MAITDSNIGSTGGRTNLKSNVWGGPFVMGLLITLLGVVALSSIVFTSLATAVFYGAMLFVGGIFEVIHAFRVRKSGPFLMFLLGGILSAVVGALVLMNPGAGLLALTLLIGGYFFASGLFRGITSIADRYEGWGWDFAYGLVSVALGVIIFAQMPYSSLWAPGILVGVEILSRGIAMMAGALTVRKVVRELPA
ncbi:HdeD family acid-resistance protein [Vitiosangium sp. GDMCC 1.1324]|uniref:HdeD family acid-resistance protein n=1 Tax=Vitiosangium sp. (strain GDMCC 1.1324) TaxID=2138576 RepID=UPI001E48CA6A|nr:HdeD family acid-resistance protein [Vitiosangium sp. GDMCC 1.1324]